MKVLFVFNLILISGQSFTSVSLRYYSEILSIHKIIVSSTYCILFGITLKHLISIQLKLLEFHFTILLCLYIETFALDLIVSAYKLSNYTLYVITLKILL